MSTLCLALLTCAPLLGPIQESKPDATELVRQAWQFLPVYAGGHRPSLSAQAERETGAAIHLLEAAVVLEPDHLRGLWSLGHAHILTGENLNARGKREAARGHLEAAVVRLSHALDLNPTDPWAAYARGTAHTAAGSNELALSDLELAIRNADAQLDENGGPSDVAWLRFKAMEWRCEVLMRARKNAAAREALAVYHGEFSSNGWPLQIAMAESHEREWDLAAAAEDYARAVELFPEDFQAHAMIAYLRGLLGDDAGAVDELNKAILLELNPGLYTRLWLLILTTGDQAAAAHADLEGLLEAPPSSMGEWDLRLGRFLLGAESPDEFVAAGQAEVGRRLEAGEALDDLMCEVYFYAGLRSQRDGDDVQAAADSYRKALRELPIKWKWEWAYARYFLAQLGAAHPVAQENRYTVEYGFFLSDDVIGALADTHWSIVGESKPRERLELAPRLGDLLMATVVTKAGERHPVTRIIGVRNLEGSPR